MDFGPDVLQLFQKKSEQTSEGASWWTEELKRQAKWCAGEEILQSGNPLPTAYKPFIYSEEESGT